jgi:hypothetical protein
MTDEQKNDLIKDSLESTLTDLTAANFVINLYSELTLSLGNQLQKAHADIAELQQQLKQRNE